MIGGIGREQGNEEMKLVLEWRGKNSSNFKKLTGEKRNLRMYSRIKRLKNVQRERVKDIRDGGARVTGHYVEN